MDGLVSPTTRDTVESVCMAIVVLLMGLGFAGFKWAQDSLFYGSLVYIAFFIARVTWKALRRMVGRRR